MATPFCTDLREDQARLPEPDGRHVAERRVRPAVAAPAHPVEGLRPEPLRRGEGAAAHQLPLEHPARGLDHRVVAGVAGARRRPLDSEGREQRVDLPVAELRPPVAVEDPDGGEQECRVREGGLDRPRACTRRIQRSSVDLPRSCSRITSARGLPESTRATIRLLNSSVSCLGCFGSRMEPPFLEGPSDSHQTVQIRIATSLCGLAHAEVGDGAAADGARRAPQATRGWDGSRSCTRCTWSRPGRATSPSRSALRPSSPRRARSWYLFTVPIWMPAGQGWQWLQYMQLTARDSGAMSASTA